MMQRFLPGAAVVCPWASRAAASATRATSKDPFMVGVQNAGAAKECVLYTTGTENRTLDSNCT